MRLKGQYLQYEIYDRLLSEMGCNQFVEHA